MRYFPWVILVLVLTIPWAVGCFYDFNGFNWKRLEIISVILGSIGIFGVIGEAQRIVPKNKLLYMKPRVNSVLELLQSLTSTHSRIISMRIENHEKGRNLCEHFQDYKYGLTWYDGLINTLEMQEDKFPSIEEHFSNFRNDLKELEVNSMVAELRKTASRYTKVKHDYEVLKIRSERSDWEIFTVFVSPLFISIAIGLSLTKAIYS